MNSNFDFPSIKQSVHISGNSLPLHSLQGKLHSTVGGSPDFTSSMRLVPAASWYVLI
jgi:hypothetical protein